MDFENLLGGEGLEVDFGKGVEEFFFELVKLGEVLGGGADDAF